MQNLIKMPRELLPRLRWVVLLCCLIYSALTLLTVLVSSNAAPLLAAVAAITQIALCLWWVRGYLRGGFPSFSIPIEAAALIGIAAGMGDSASRSIALFFLSLFFRALYGSRRDALLLVVSFITANIVVLVFVQQHVVSTVPEEALVRTLTMLMEVAIVKLLTVSMRRQEQAAGRQAILTSAGTALVAAPDSGSMYTATLDAALALISAGPTNRVALALGDAGTMKVVAAVGYRAAQIKDQLINLNGLPASFQQALAHQQTVELNASCADLGMIARSAALLRGSTLVTPLIIGDSLGGVLVSSSEEPMMPAAREALDVLGPLVALALESARLNRDLHRRSSEERLAALVQNSSDVITIVDAAGTISYQSPSMERIFGYSRADLAGKSLLDLAHPDDREGLADFLTATLAASGSSAKLECRLTHHDGSWHDIEISGTNLTDEAAVAGIVLNSRDISERKRAENEIAELGRYNRTLVESSLNALIITDANGTITDVNMMMEKFTGLPRIELIGTSLADYMSDPAQAQQGLLATLTREVLRDFSTEMRHQDGHMTPVLFNATVFRDAAGAVAGILASARDMTERLALERQLSHLAFHDPLTGLPNRTLFMDRLGHALVRTERSSGTLALIFLDLDNFKVINDSLGHQEGDELLLTVARRLQECMRPADTAARLGGDEFTILLEDIEDLQHATVVAERIQEKLQQPIMLAGREVFITTSIGIALSTPGEYKPETLLRNADVAMYSAKNKGKARFAVFEPRMNSRLWERLELQSELRHALEREEFRIHYQPVVDLATGRMIEVEALIRWQHPQRGLISPAQFVPVLEETGLILPVGQWVLQQASQQVCAWQTEHKHEPPLTLSVNLSAKQFQQQTLVQEVRQVLEDSELSPWQLKLEITETNAMEDAESTITTFTGLKDLGVRLAIDDFGTGYSSLSYLKRYAVDTLKIDRSFVSGLEHNSEDRAIAQTIVAVAKNLGLRVTAEGIETAEQLDHLRAMGCDLGQGYYFARPMKADAVAELLRDGSNLVDEAEKRNKVPAEVMPLHAA